MPALQVMVAADAAGGRHPQHLELPSHGFDHTGHKWQCAVAPVSWLSRIINPLCPSRLRALSCGADCRTELNRERHAIPIAGARPAVVALCCSQCRPMWTKPRPRFQWGSTWRRSPDTALRLADPRFLITKQLLAAEALSVSPHQIEVGIQVADQIPGLCCP